MLLAMFLGEVLPFTLFQTQIGHFLFPFSDIAPPVPRLPPTQKNLYMFVSSRLSYLEFMCR